VPKKRRVARSAPGNRDELVATLGLGLSGERTGHSLGLRDVAAGVGVLGVELEHATPLLDGG
jgi:hypothetical protein